MALREDIAKAIMVGIKESPGEPYNYSPDDVYRWADEVVAMLMSKLTGQRFETSFHPTLIGPAKFFSDGVIYD